MKTTARACVLCRQLATVTDWAPVAWWLAVEDCLCGGFLVWTPLWDGLAALSDAERKDVMARVQAARARGREAWLTTKDGRIDGHLVVWTDRPR